MNDDIILFFSGHMDALPIYEKLERQLLTWIPDIKIKVSKTQITFANKYGFAFVSFNPCRKAADRPKVWITVSFGLGYRNTSGRVDSATEAFPGRWTHHITVGCPDEIDEELMEFIMEAAVFSAEKR